MAGVRDLKRHFPLQDISSVVKLFKEQLEITAEPDLALLSIIVGAIENSLTCSRSLILPQEADTCSDEVKLPIVEYHIVEALYTKFHAVIKGSVDLSLYDNKFASRELVKKVSDVIWNSLTRSYYKDRAHLQSLYSYLTGNKLDCFGVAFAVVAGCQALGFRDVHLALSEDHAWVLFGERGDQSAEVTWHGKGNEDKRGQAVAGSTEGSHTWLYLNGCPVVCTRPMEVAALVSAINPSLNATSDAVEVALLQQELLWLLYDLGHLSRYPMALGNLGDLEEICPTPGRPPCSTLFLESISSGRLYYKNQHVYPYTYQGGYFYRNKMYKEAFQSWANSGDVIRQYNYSRDDEEIYKEFLEIANELIPHIMKVVSSGHSARSILKDPECFAYLLRFYDGICQWEECSPTPVLHIGWAKPLVNTISKFDAHVRAQVVIVCEEEEETSPANPGNSVTSCEKKLSRPRRRRSDQDGEEDTEGEDADSDYSSDNKYLISSEYNNNYKLQAGNNQNAEKGEGGIVEGEGRGGDVVRVGHEWKAREFLRSLESQVGPLTATAAPHPSIAALTEACGETILNPGYLLGCGEPFAANRLLATAAGPPEDEEEEAEEENECDDASSATVSAAAPTATAQMRNPLSSLNGKESLDEQDSHPRLILHSRKMMGLKDLLLSEKLNTHAISLQLTAQSQVQVGRKTRASTDVAELSLTANNGGTPTQGSGMQGLGMVAATRAKRARTRD